MSALAGGIYSWSWDLELGTIWDLELGTIWDLELGTIWDLELGTIWDLELGVQVWTRVGSEWDLSGF